MAQIKPDFTDAVSFEAVPDDVYKVRIEKADTFNSQEKGLPMIKLNLVITDTKNDANGRHLFRNVPATGKGSGFLRSLLEVLDIPENTFTDTNVLIGKALKVKTKVEQYEGQDQSRVTAFLKSA